MLDKSLGTETLGGETVIHHASVILKILSLSSFQVILDLFCDLLIQE